NPNLARYIEFVELPSILTHKNDALRVPLLFDPGTDWEYGIGIDLVGKVIEAVTGPGLGKLFSAAHRQGIPPISSLCGCWPATRLCPGTMLCLGTRLCLGEGTQYQHCRIIDVSLVFPIE